MEKTLVIIKPDAVNRGLIGEVLHRFERKGLKVIGMKMQHLSEEVLEEHYSHLSGKPFFKGLVDFMKSAPSILLAVEFALFGTRRGELSGEGLLRNGKSEGFVELVFSLDDKEYIIKRSLKRSKDDVKQTAGHIIEGNTKKDG